MKLLAHYQNALESADPQIRNWRINYLSDSLFYSYRTTRYNRETYPSSLHYHDYYELVIPEEGEILYICEGCTFRPEKGDIILIPPRRMHMSAINADETLYKRHVFYLYPNALDAFGCGALTSFLPPETAGHSLFTLPPDQKDALFSLLQRLDKALENASDEKEKALSVALVIEAFYMFSRAGMRNDRENTRLPESVLAIQRYIDEHYAQIDSVSEIAAHFYYSREYVSRLFRRHFNTTVADYILKRRISQSQTLIKAGTSLCEVCFSVGFGSMSAFIKAFRKLTGLSPSKYRVLLREKADGNSSRETR